MTENRRTHWDGIYAEKQDRAVSWFEPEPTVSLSLLEAAGLRPDTRILDVGGGHARLVDALLARGLTAITVIDVSARALDRARARLGTAAAVPRWVVADVAGAWSVPPVDIWHDRAVFHFLTDDAERARYREHLEATLVPGGTAIIATFAPDGPERCSGLPVRRSSPESIAQDLGPGVTLVGSRRHVHTTPWGSMQPFMYAVLRRLPDELLAQPR